MILTKIRSFFVSESLARVVWFVLACVCLLACILFTKTYQKFPALTTDDALSNVSYLIQEEGRIGTLNGPLQAPTRIPRNDGFFNYGPFYFILGAAWSSTFGFSIENFRLLNFFLMMSCVFLICVWFRDQSLGFFCVGLFLFMLCDLLTRRYIFIARPDAMVPVMSLALILSLRQAVFQKSRIYWFVSGVFAGLAGFTHPFGMGVVSSVGMVFLLFLYFDILETRPIWPVILKYFERFLLLVLGFLVSACGYFQAFHWNFDKFSRFFLNYHQKYQAHDNAIDLVDAHLWTAFSYLRPLPWKFFLILGFLYLVFLVAKRTRSENEKLDAILLAFFYGYLPFLCFYSWVSGFYSGPLQICFFLVATVIFRFLFEKLFKSPARRAVVGQFFLIFVGTAWVGKTLFFPPEKIKLSQSYPPVSSQIDKVLESIPLGSTAWGTVYYGVENPGRVQLVQYYDGLVLAEYPRVPPVSRKHIPEFIVHAAAEWSHFWESLAPGKPVTYSTERVHTVAPGARYRLDHLVLSQPYGIVKVYKLVEGESQKMGELPKISFYVPEQDIWSSSLGREQVLEFSEINQSLRINFRKWAKKYARQSISSVEFELGPGRYILKVNSDTDTKDAVCAIERKVMAIRLYNHSAAADCDIFKKGINFLYLEKSDSGPGFLTNFMNKEGLKIKSISAYRLEEKSSKSATYVDDLVNQSKFK